MSTDLTAELRSHLIEAGVAPRWVERLCKATRSVEHSTFGPHTSLEGRPALKVTLPLMEDGEVIDESLVTLFCGEPFLGTIADSVSPSVASLSRIHNGLVVQHGADIIALFEGLGADGALTESPTLDVPGCAVDCFPNGWAVIEQSAVRWRSEETRALGVTLWPDQPTGAVICQTVLAVALGYHPAHVQARR